MIHNKGLGARSGVSVQVQVRRRQKLFWRMELAQVAHEAKTRAHRRERESGQVCGRGEVP